MCGLLGKLIAQTGKRDELIAALLEGPQNMPGCLSYIVAKADENGIWVTAVWDSTASRKSSLSCRPSARRSRGHGRASPGSANDSRPNRWAAWG
jgi:hypothetical protein